MNAERWPGDTEVWTHDTIVVVTIGGNEYPTRVADAFHELTSTSHWGYHAANVTHAVARSYGIRDTQTHLFLEYVRGVLAARRAGGEPAMDKARAVAMAVNLMAPDAPREVVVLCVCCLEDQDPKWEWPVHRAPASAECMACTDDARRREGMVFAVRPRPMEVR